MVLHLPLWHTRCRFIGGVHPIAYGGAGGIEESDCARIFTEVRARAAYQEFLAIWKVTVECPLRLHSQLSLKAIETLRFSSDDEDLRGALYEEFGDELFANFDKVSTALEIRLVEWSSDDEESDARLGSEMAALSVCLFVCAV